MTQAEYKQAVKEARRIMLFATIRADGRGGQRGTRISKAAALRLVSSEWPADVAIRAEWADRESGLLFVG